MTSGQTPAPVRLVLASGSPRRRDLIAELGYAAELMPAEVDEWNTTTAAPAEVVLHNARLKARWASERRPAQPVLGSDTVVALGDTLLHKPADMDEARSMLLRLAGRAHIVYTAVALVWLDRAIEHSFVEQSKVVFKPFDTATADAYFKLVYPLDKAGAYGIQEEAGRGLVLDHWQGSFNNIMGLPTERLETTFEQLGWARCLIRTEHA